MKDKNKLNIFSSADKYAHKKILSTVFIVLTVMIIIFSYFSYRIYFRNMRVHINNQLTAITELKVSEIDQYVMERIGNGKMLFKRDMFYDTVERYFKNPLDVNNTLLLNEWLERYSKYYQYNGVSLFDVNGKLRISSPDEEKYFCCPEALKNVQEILNLGRVQLSDFYRSLQNGKIYLFVQVPILSEKADRLPIGVLFLQIDPENYIYPFINKWPVPSETAETLLVKRDGNDVLFLNEVKYQKDAALNLRFKIDNNKDLPVVKAVLGQTGIVEGLDYRKNPVISCIRAIENTPWFIVVSISQAEAYALIRQHRRFIIWLDLILIIALGAIIWLILWRRDLLFYRQEYSSALLLKASEERYRKLFESTKDGVILLDMDTGMIMDVNPSLIGMLGCSKNDLFEKYIWEIDILNNIVSSKENFKELKRKRFAHQEDISLKTKTGIKIETELVTNVYSCGDKNIIQINIRDITERKNIQRELAASKETQFRSLIDNLPGKVFLKDNQSVYLVCNTNYAKDLGIEAKSIKGKTDFDFFPTLLAEKYRKDDKRVMESQKTENIEEEYQVVSDFLQEPRTIYINTVKVPVFDNKNNVVGVFGFFWDITQRKKSEESLRLNEMKIRAIFDQTFQFIGLMTLEGKLIEANRTAMQFAGIKESDCLGKFFWNTPWWTHSKELQNKLKEAVAKVAIGDTVKFEATHLDAQKNIHYIDFSLKPVKDEQGKVIFLLPEGRDITESKKNEQELAVYRDHLEELVKEKTKTVEDALKVKLDFTEMVTHELRTPLAAIQLGVSIVLDEVSGPINQDQEKYLNIVKGNVDRLGRLINAVLDFEKLSSGKMEFVHEENDLNEVVKSVNESIQLLFKKKNIDLKLELEVNLPKARFDKDKIVQVLTNLVNNALKFTEKGEVSIITGKRGNYIQVQVKDTGIGIAQENMHKLFIEFMQIQRKVGGTGLGLSICRKIIQAHHGKIWAESEFGKGSSFYFTLPI